MGLLAFLGVLGRDHLRDCSILEAYATLTAGLEYQTHILHFIFMGIPVQCNIKRFLLSSAMLAYLYHSAKNGQANLRTWTWQQTCNFMSDIMAAFNLSAGKPWFLRRVSPEHLATFWQCLIGHLPRFCMFCSRAFHKCMRRGANPCL